MRRRYSRGRGRRVVRRVFRRRGGGVRRIGYRM